MTRVRFLTSFAVILVGSAAGGDVVTLHGKAPFERVEVLNFRDGMLVFRGLSRELLHKPLNEVARIELTNEPDFTAAEQLRRTDPAQSIEHYRKALDHTDVAWRQDLTRWRRLGALDHADSFAAAVDAWLERIEALKDNAILLALMPNHPGAPESVANLAARERLTKYLQMHPRGLASDAVRALLFELLILDDVQSHPLLNRHIGARTTATQPTNDEATDDDLPPLLFGDTSRSTRRRGAPPAGMRWDGPVRVRPDSFLLRAIRDALNAGQLDRAARMLDRALPQLSHEDPPATLPWRIAAAGAFVQLDRAAEAKALYTELTRDAATPENIRQQARRAITRIETETKD